MSSKLKRSLITLGVGTAIAIAAGVMLSTSGPASQPRSLARAQLDLRDGALYPLDDPATPFTGTLTETYTDGTPKIAIDIVAGRADGLSRGWFDNGQLEVEEHFTAGTAHGIRTRWHKNGNIRSTATIVDGTLDGPFREWHPDGQLAATMTMVGGQPHGECHAFYPDGTPKSKVVMQHGKPLSRQFFPAITAR